MPVRVIRRAGNTPENTVMRIISIVNNNAIVINNAIDKIVNNI